MRTRRGRGSSRTLGAAAALVVALPLAAAGASVGSANAWAASASLSGSVSSALPGELLAPLTTPNTSPPTGSGIEAALAPALATKSLGPVTTVAVYDALSGQLIYNKSAGSPATPASTNKLLTAAAALTAYGADHRLKTAVVAGATPNEIVLVGGGDPLLRSANAPASEPQAASLSELANQTAAALLPDGETSVTDAVSYTLRFDDGLFSGPLTSPTWPQTYVQEGIVSRITALLTDGGFVSGITPDPSLASAQKFASLLKARGVKLSGAPTRADAPQQANELSAVLSLPMSAIVQQSLERSDNTTSEVLAHLAGAELKNDGSFNGGAAAVSQVLTDLGISPDGVQLFDGSGLSRENLVPAQVLGQVVNAMATNVNPELWAGLYGMPVAGFTGTLNDRFVTPATQPGRGEVRAKTGTLTGVITLSGLVTGADGDLLSFAFMAPKAQDLLSAEVAWDEAAAALAECGCK